MQERAIENYKIIKIYQKKKTIYIYIVYMYIY